MYGKMESLELFTLIFTTLMGFPNFNDLFLKKSAPVEYSKKGKIKWFLLKLSNCVQSDTVIYGIFCALVMNCLYERFINWRPQIS